MFAASFPLGRLEAEVLDRLPRRSVPLVVYGEGAEDATAAAGRLRSLGYRDVSLLEGGLAGWAAGGGELFRDVNAPSKAFGELVEATAGTPAVAASQLRALLRSGADVVVLDARRFEEYHTMSIPTATSVPGAELVMRAGALAPDPATLVVVNCAGRTRSIIGTQSLINAGLPNRVVALRNGTIGWSLAGLELEHGQQRRAPGVPPAMARRAEAAAWAVARKAGVGRIGASRAGGVAGPRDADRLPVRRPLPRGLRRRPPGRVPVCSRGPAGAGDRPVRPGPGSPGGAGRRWRRPGRDDRVLAGPDGLGGCGPGRGRAAAGLAIETGPWAPAWPPPPEPPQADPAQVESWLREGAAAVVDVDSSRQFEAGHVPGAAWALRTDLGGPGLADRLGRPGRLVLTSADGTLARFAAADAPAGTQVLVLAGGTTGWERSGRPLESGPATMLSPVIDVYRRPYEGTGVHPDAMQAYLDWEYGLVGQLERDGTHGFRVLR